MNRISTAARTVARMWAAGRTASPVTLLDIAEQAQDHLDHGADEQYLRDVAKWMRAEQPSWQDLSFAMRFASAPKPPPTTAPGPRRNSTCPCRGSLVLASAA